MIRPLHKLFIVLLSLGVKATAFGGPVVHIPERVHNFGAFMEESGLAECSFAVVNIGDEPLVILSAKATCGCTTPKYPRESIAPGDTAYINVAYDPDGRPGRFQKPIYIETNGTPSKTRVDIQGVVIGNEETIGKRYPVDFGPLKLAKANFLMGDVTMGHFRNVYLDGYNRSTDSLRISIEDVPSYLDITFTPKVVPPGEQVTLIAYILPHKGADYGIVEDTITVTPVPGMSYRLPTVLNVQEDFSKLDAAKKAKAPVVFIDTERLDFGKVSKNDETKQASFRISNQGASDLKIRRIYSTDKGISAKVGSESLKKGKSTEVVVSILPELMSGEFINSRLQIITNDPVHPVRTLRIVGEWQ